jgi:hypothetical protein
MPRGNAKGQQRDWESPADRQKKNTYGMNAGFSGWVNYTIPASERPAYDQWVTGEGVWSDLTAVIESHYRLSVGEDLRDGGFTATAFMRLESSPHAGKMTSQRSSTPMNAITKLVFAITHGMPENWRDLETGGQDDW